MTMLNQSSSSMGVTTPTKRRPESQDSTSPTISRYGRSHKPKMQDDYVSTDRKVSAILKLSPGNQLQYFSTTKEPKKKLSPKKSDTPVGTPRRGRPPKVPLKNANGEDVLKTVIKMEPQDPSSAVEGCEWMVGDLAWARVGGHPFWPCIIALDPVQKVFTKTIRKGRTLVSQRWVHVQFFGDNGRRSWLNSTSIMNYNGRDAFIQLGDTIMAGMRKKDPKQTSAFVIKPAVMQVWEKAVQEAEDLINSSREERIGFFTTHFPLLPEPEPTPRFTREELLEKALTETTPSPPKKRGRKRKAEQSPMVDETKKIKLEKEEKETEPVNPLLTSTPRTIADRKKRQALLMQLARSNQSAPSTPTAAVSPKPVEATPTPPVAKPAPVKRPASTESPMPVEQKKPKKKYVKKKVPADFQTFSSKHFDRVSDDHPELNVKEVKKYLKKMWNEMDETQKAKYRSRLTGAEKEESESASETSEEVEGSSEDNEEESRSKSSSPAPLAVATQKATTAKRNNCKYLFSGAKSEKVCQICEYAGDTVKCRGPCQGYYHPDCVANPPTLQPVTPTPKKGKRGRPKKSLEQSPSVVSSPTNQPEPMLKLQKLNLKEDDNKPIVENGRIPSKDDHKSSDDVERVPTKDDKLPLENGEITSSESGQQLSQKLETKENIQQNGVDEKPESSENGSQEELAESEGKSSTKVRKGSKDSESGSGEEGEGFRCKDCQEGRSQPCFVCHEYVQKKTGETKLHRCITAYCGKVYHEECLKPWPQCSWRSNGNGKNCERGVVTCPQHTCHTCVSDNPGVIKARYSNDKLVRCIRCPTSYHYGNYCLPAGSDILTNTQVICPQHYLPPRKGVIHHVNAAWCFICASGGSLICCDLCPTAFHADCLKISTPPDGSYVCEDCLTGRFPLYGEIVWVKLGTYRWWPAEILYPALIPDNILNLPHVRGEFAVRFFGSHDHYWVNRGRVFLYQDGDTAGKGNYKKSSVDHVFERAVREASEAQRKYLEEKATRDAETRPGMKPPVYVKLKTNKPVGNVRTMEMNLSSLTPCECDPNSEAPCAPESDCLNRILMVECHPQVCPAGEKCRNQLFEKREYPPLQPYQTQGRGWGLKTLVALKKGDFVIEYVGEMIDEEEYKKRLAHMHKNNEENFYFLTIDKDRMLDAGPKGNVARFMNHSCQPNCETQKWTVNGDTRVGLFALCDIPAQTELIFNYNLESIGSDKKPCMCGAPNCSGFIGVKANKNQDKEKEEGSKEKKVVKKKKSVVVSKSHEEECFVCGEGGELLLCDGKHCTKGYHQSCLGKKQRPQGYWLCPWHQCNVCNKGRVRRCTFCVNSFCQEHSEGNIRLDSVRGLVCQKHDQDNIADNVIPARKEEELIPMDVDMDTSDLSTTVSSQNSSDSGIKEPINNNVIKPVNTPGCRTRRSRSLNGGKPSADTVVNGAVSKRNGRPSSVDEKLIVSCAKTEHNINKNSKQNDADSISDGQKNVKELLNQVINSLPIENTKNLETILESVNNDNKKSEDVIESKIEERVDESINKEELENQSKEINQTDSEKTSKEIETSEESIIQNHNMERRESNDDHKKEEINPVKNIDKEDSIITTDISVSPSDNANASVDVEENKPKTENIISTESLESELPNPSKKSDSDESSTTPAQEIVKINEISETTANKTEDFELNLTAENTTPTKECTKENLVEIPEKSELPSIENTNEKPQVNDKISAELCKGDDKINEKIDKEEETVPSTTTLAVDEHVDDFELSYSEYSNDKTYKSVNSESSIEMKLTDCSSTEEVRINNKIEEISNKSDLVNCIDQSNIMEVA